MSTNISKNKRDDLVSKIKSIHTYISSAPQDENTGALLVYLSELEKEVKSKKFGLVFEEHIEEIDKTLETHVPVLSEQKELFINNDGMVNFLIEGDNLAALQLLLKTHRQKVDLIYIDPPYNTGQNDFIYDDCFVDKEDGFRHSKWLSFMDKRLQIVKHLLAPSGVLVISIGYHELNNLVILCESLFLGKQVVTVTVQTSGGKPSGGFNYLQEYLVFVTNKDFVPNPMQFAGGNSRSPFEGLTLATFTQTQRPNQTYPIFIDKKSGHIVGCGESLTDRIKNGKYTGDPADFKFDYSEAPEGTSALWPVSSKGGHCVWRLISTRLMDDWAKGYIKVSKNKSKVNPNEYSVQYLPEGVIKKIESNQLPIVGTEKNNPTLILGENQTVGSDIPTIWTEKAFFTTKGTSEVKEIFDGEKRFSYPKPVALISEIIRACSHESAIVLDFFAGSGTTGQSVVELNAVQGDNRRFILCTNNENNICREVTYERIKRVFEKEGYSDSLKYYRISHVPISDRVYYEYADELLRHVRELVELENGINFTGNAEIAIVLTDEELDEFINNVGEYTACQRLYRGHDILLSATQEDALKLRDITVCVIPDYYYRDLEG